MNENNYGFVFNDITLKDQTIHKKYKNLLGKVKINYEINFYLYINKNNIHFRMPDLLNYEDGSLCIKYINESTTLTNKITLINMYYYIDKIKEQLQNIHSIHRTIEYKNIEKDIEIEINKKILTRYSEYNWDLCLLYQSIKFVNGIKIQNIVVYSSIIQSKLKLYLKERNYYNLIHGDIHLGNILLDNNDDIYFIDPRGYFGKTELFGLYEYDYAKLLFGLSGYSIFDNMVIDELDIDIHDNITIDFLKKYEFIFESNMFDKITILFSLSIWLANNSCFYNINKKITSLMIAYFYCEKYLDKC